jgi:uncharacterized protein (TIGR03437 family)
MRKELPHLLAARLPSFTLICLTLALLGAGYGLRRSLLVPAHAQGQGATANTLPVADFNADGKLDYAFIYDGRDVVIALGNGDGTFRYAVRYALGTSPYNLRKGDFNGDGKVDLAAVYGSSDMYVGVLIGRGDGTFSAPVRYRLEPFIGWRGLDVGDFNGDGKSDFVVAGGRMTVLLGQGDGNFLVLPSQDFDTFTFGGSAAAADFNGDGKLDVVVANNDFRISLMFGNGDGRFTAPAYYELASKTLEVVVGDYDSDGKPDVAVAHESSISIFFNLGDGALGSRRDYGVGSPADLTSILTSADFNGDAKPELLLFALNAQAKNVVVLLSPQCGRRISTPVTLDTHPSFGNLPGDFDGDGKTDVIALTADFDGNPQVRFFPNPDAGPPASACAPGYGDPAVSFAAPLSAVAGPSASRIAAADFNLDGHLDLAVTNLSAPQGVSIHLGDGTGRFPAWTAGNHLPISRADHTVVADVNADNKPDLLVVRDRFGGIGAPVLITPYYGNGDGTFSAGADITIQDGFKIVLEVKDYNGDGKLDLAACVSQALLFYPGRGDGTFGAPVRTPLGAFTAQSAATADYDGDGRLDLALVDSDHRGRYVLMFGRGDGTFAARENDNRGFPILEPTGADGAQIVRAGDFNNDARPDLAITLNASLLAYEVMLNTGGANFTKRLQRPEFGINLGRPVVGDFNKDGRLDLAHAGSNAFTVLPGLGDGNFSWNYYVDAGVGAGDAVAGDFNNDGRLDVAVARSGRCQDTCPSSVAVFLNTTSAANPQPLPTPTPRPSPTPTPTPPTTYTIKGQVVNQAGQGLALIPLQVSGTQSGTRYTTGSNGFYQFSLLPRGGNYTITPKGGGYNFTPASQSVTNLRADTVFNFTALPANPMVTVTAPTYEQGELAFEAIASIFGSNLSTATDVAASQPLPLTLGGSTVTVRDSQGTERPAPLFYVSPTQINYQIPVGTAAGVATVYVTSSNGTASACQVTIAQVRPGFFSADSTGTGWAAADIQRVKADGQQAYEHFMQYNPARNEVLPVAIDLGPEGEQVYLILYGTGLRFRSHINSVTARVGAQTAATAYAGPQPQFAGLDQVNILIPRALKGAGDVDVTLTFDGKAANTLKVKIK